MGTSRPARNSVAVPIVPIHVDVDEDRPPGLVGCRLWWECSSDSGAGEFVWRRVDLNAEADDVGFVIGRALRQFNEPDEPTFVLESLFAAVCYLDDENVHQLIEECDKADDLTDSEMALTDAWKAVQKWWAVKNEPKTKSLKKPKPG